MMARRSVLLGLSAASITSKRAGSEAQPLTGQDNIAAPALLSRLGLPQTLEAWGGVGDNSVDNQPVIAAMLKAGVREIKLGAGDYKCASSLPEIGYPIHIRGISKGSSVLRFTQTSGTLMRFHSATQLCTPTLEDFSVLMAGGANVDAAIHLLAHSQDFAPDFAALHRLNITGETPSSTASYGLLLDGAPRQGAGSGLTGLRDLTIESCEVFNTTMRAIEGQQLRVCAIRDTRCFATGNKANAAVAFDGPSAQFKTDGLKLSDNNMLGALTLGHVAHADITGDYGATTLGAGSEMVVFSGEMGDLSLNGRNAVLNGIFGTVTHSATAQNCRVTGLGTNGGGSGKNVVIALN